MRPRLKRYRKKTYGTQAYRKYYNSKNKSSSFLEQLYDLSPETKKTIASIFLITFGLILILSLSNIAGRFGDFLNHYLSIGFGIGKWYFPLVLIVFGYFLARPRTYKVGALHYVGLVLFILATNGIAHILRFHRSPIDLSGGAFAGEGGGLVGWLLSYPLFLTMGFWSTFIILFALILVSLFLLFNASFASIAESKQNMSGKIAGLFVKLRLKKADDNVSEEGTEQEFEEQSIGVDVDDGTEGKEEEQKEDAEVEESEEEEEESDDEAVPEKIRSALVTKGSQSVDLPVSLLNGRTEKPTSGDIKANQQVIKKTLSNFRIDAEMGEVNIGPTVTQYTLKPAEGVKLSKIISLGDNLALALAAHPIRIEAPIPGKSLVGIEVPNQSTAVVPLKNVVDSEEFRNRQSNLMLCLGLDVKGKAWIADLGRMPHVLIAGATGSGKSVCINTIIIGLLYQNSPDMLKFIMVDPKRVELPVYNGIPHLLTPVITNTKKTINSLKWAIGEMERRFERLEEFHKRNIQSYNDSVDEKMPYIVIVIDELADLMASSGPEVEGAIIRLAQMSRAVGIHLILATQRPSVDVITGLIKANIPGRIAFSVASGIDSRTILDGPGAEKLLGRGDMLFLSAEISKPKRIQGGLATDIEIKRIIQHLKKQGTPEYLEEVTERQSTFGGNGNSSEVSDDDDPLLPEAREIILKAGKASASYLQRRLRVGYARAARLLDLLEARGIIGPADGAKPREILMKASPNDIMDKVEEEDSGAEDIIERSEDEVSEESQNDEIGEENPEIVEDEEDEPEDDFSKKL